MKIQDITEGYGRYYCSTDKKWKTRKGPKQTRKTESVEQGVAEGLEQEPTIHDYHRARDELSKIPKGTEEHTQAVIDIQKLLKAVIAAEKKQQQGVAEGSASGTKILYTGKDKGGTVTISYEPDYIPGHSEKYITRFDGRVKSEMPTLRSAVYGLTHYQFDTFRPNLQPNPKTALEQGVAEEKQRLDPKCWDGYKKDGTKMKGGVRVNNCVKEELEETYDGDEFFEAYGELWYNEDEQLDEAEYQGRSVPLGKPMQGDVKKFKVYVKDPSTGNVKKVNFGDPDMKIRKSNPAARRSFRARHNCDNPGPRTKARYWSCRKW